MRLRHLIISMLMMIAAGSQLRAQSFFQYPIVPDSISTLTARCNFLANHFWDYCDLKSAFSSKQRMADEFKGYLEILQLASPDTALTAVDRFTARLDKQPKDLLFIAGIAEAELYSDSAKVWVDELYIPFARAVERNKRVDKASKLRFKHQADILTNSLPGTRIPSIPYVTADGRKGDVLNDSAQVIVLFINDPECSECSLARIRLHADISTSQLIDDGVVKIISISAVDPDDKWKTEVADYPADWIVAANPDIDMTLDLRGGTPSFYILDRNHKIRFKHLDVNQVLDVMRQLKKR